MIFAPDNFNCLRLDVSLTNHYIGFQIPNGQIFTLIVRLPSITPSSEDTPEQG